MFKKILILVGWTAIIAGGVLVYENRANFNFASLENIIDSTISNLHLEKIATDLAQKVSMPSPLRRLTGVLGNLTVSGTVNETNKQRQLNGNLPPLSVNLKLTAAANAKIDDMLKNQYFEHVSPSGRGPAELVKDENYEYILVGENLALGNFSNDADLVAAWMNSPGHRANILNSRYTEIGVAVRKGIFEGRTTWLAVQEFGRPLSSCPQINADLKIQIDINQRLIADLNSQITAKKAEIDNYKPKRGPEYNEMIDEYNALVAQYNTLAAATKDMINTYNAEIKMFNACVAG